MQWQTATMTIWELWHIGGAMPWSLIKHVHNSSTLVISQGRKNQMSVNHYIAMPWIKSLGALISITLMHLLATSLMVPPLLLHFRPFGCLIDPRRYTNLYIQKIIITSFIIFLGILSDIEADFRLWSLHRKVCWDLLQQAWCAESPPC